MVKPVVYRQAEVKEAYNELTLVCKDYSIVFRAYGKYYGEHQCKYDGADPAP